MSNAVEDWLAKQAPEARAGIEALRAIVRRAGPGLEESVKWNAPSYADAGADRVTLGLERKGGFRVVLHRGAAASVATGFRFQDQGGLATWPSADRGVVQFPDAAAIAAGATGLEDLVRCWLEATRAGDKA